MDDKEPFRVIEERPGCPHCNCGALYMIVFDEAENGEECGTGTSYGGPPVNLYLRDCTSLHWVIVGGESGHGARFMQPKWARALRDQCLSNNVAFFMKQMTNKEAIPADLLVRQFPAYNPVQTEGE